MDKSTRENIEFISVYSDERFAKQAWKKLIGRALDGPAAPLRVYDAKTGEPTPQTVLEVMAYENIKARLLADGLSREPMQSELLIECNIIRTRHDNSVFNTILDRTAGKVKDEIQVSASPYEDLTDDELAVLAQYRSQNIEEDTNG